MPVQRPHEVVARGEQHRGARRVEQPDPPETARAGLARRRAARRPPTIASAPTISGALTGSPRKTIAIATAASGAAPTVTEVRDAPVSWTARVNRICDAPGAIRPASRNGQAPWSGGTKRGCDQRDDERREDRGERRRAAPRRPRRPSRIATVIAPNSAAEATASRTAVTRHRAAARDGRARRPRPARRARCPP